MINGIIGIKSHQTQGFQANGRRIPITRVSLSDVSVVAVKTYDKNGYMAVQLGIGNPPFRFIKEVRLSDKAQDLPKPQDVLKASDVLRPGDIVDVTGISKGKGFAGVVKRHHFKGGPRTHGQSDRERAPGSIGQTTTPGRVYKGKRMAGKMGRETTTVKNMRVIEVTQDSIDLKGLLPGSINSLVMIKKVGEDKKFVPSTV